MAGPSASRWPRPPGGTRRAQRCCRRGTCTRIPRSVGFLLSFGRFTFLDVGDLTARRVFALACPDDLLGHVDVYLVAHHGGPDAADPATLSAFTPRVAILNNGRLKGGGRRRSRRCIGHQRWTIPLGGRLAAPSILE
jgi:hypothetical protein